MNDRLTVKFLLSIVIILISKVYISASDFGKHYYPDNQDSNNFIRILHISDLHIDYFNIFSRNYLKNISSLKGILKNISPNLVILSGDIVEFGEGIFSCINYQIFTNIFKFIDNSFWFDYDKKIPIYTIPGNHEYHTFLKISYWDIPNYEKYIGKGFRNYFIDISNVRIVFIDTGYDYYFSPWNNNQILPEPEGTGINSYQIEFIEKSLSNCDKKIKILVTHHPFINLSSDIEEGIFLFNRKEFYNILKKYGVSLVISGHTHKNKVYSSDNKLIKNFPIILDTNKTTYIQTGSIGKDGCFRIIDIYEDKIKVYDSEVVEDGKIYR